jgi:hypothetical protein
MSHPGFRAATIRTAIGRATTELADIDQLYK